MFQTVKAADVPTPKTPKWLIEDVWAHQGVGLVVGQPKCCKSMFTASIAVSVASGLPLLNKWPVHDHGTVLMHNGEDKPYRTRERLEAAAGHLNTDLDDLDIRIIEKDKLLLDHPFHAEELRTTVEEVKPTLLILDPLVQLLNSPGAENSVSTVSPILSLLRSFGCAVILVHHAARVRKGPGSARGSTALHAWGDSNVYLTKMIKRIAMKSEQRNADSAQAILEVVSGPCLKVL